MTALLTRIHDEMWERGCRPGVITDVCATLGHMDEREQEVFLLRMEGLNETEVGEIMHCNHATVSRALPNLYPIVSLMLYAQGM